MKRPLLLIALLMLSTVPATAVAQLPDPGLPPGVPGPGDLPDPEDAPEPPGGVPDPENPPEPPDPPEPEDVVGEVTGLAENPLLTLRQWDCPVNTWFGQRLAGKTSWTNGTYPGSDDGCVAQWGQSGSYQAGSDTVLTSPGLPTGHLASTSISDPAATREAAGGLNELAQTLLEAGFTPKEVGRFAATCASVTRGSGDISGIGSDPGTHCRNVFEGIERLKVPTLRGGAANVWLTMEHAYQFENPDSNGFARDGGWVEIRQAGGSWTRLDPVALYTTTEEGTRVLCAASAPARMDLLPALRLGSGTAFGFGQFVDDFTQLDSEQEWREQCKGLVGAANAATNPSPFVTGFSQILGLEDPDEGADTSQRHASYPGIIRGQGRGFVGDTASGFGNDTGEPELVEHWFDLSPFAGETVEVRLHAFGGPGVGEKSGGWWVDEISMLYGGPPSDVAVRIDHPTAQESYPPGTVPVETEVVNLGRTASEPLDLIVSMGEQQQRVELPALNSLQRNRTTLMFNAALGSHEVTATIVPRESPEGTPIPGDTYPLNNEATATLVAERLEEVTLGPATATVNDAQTKATVNLTIANDGNQLTDVAVLGTLTPIDRVTRNERTQERIPLGEVAFATVPHSREVNPLGVAHPETTVEFDVDLPGPGVWRIQLTTQGGQGATESVTIPLDTAAPPAIVERFSSVTKGPTFNLPNATFETEDGVFTVDPLDPIKGPDSRFVLEGKTALASSGEDVPSDIKRESNVRSDVAGATIGAGDRCEETEAALADFVLLDGFTCQLGIPVEAAASAGVPAAGLPLAAQTWNVREHHLAVYEIDPSKVDDDEGPGALLAPPWRDGDYLRVGFDHAAKVQWNGEDGSLARALVVRTENGTTFKEALNATQNIVLDNIEDPTVRRAVEDLVQNAALDAILDVLTQTTGVDQIPGDICRAGTNQNIDIAFDTLDTVWGLISGGDSPFSNPESLCSSPNQIRSLEPRCIEDSTTGTQVRCQLPEEDVAAYARFFEQSSGTIAETTFTDPTGWEHVDLDISSAIAQIIEEQNLDTTGGVDPGELEGATMFVIFDLQTVTDFQTILASARAAEQPGRTYPSAQAELGATDSCDFVDTCERQAVSDPLTIGWDPEAYPLWTVDNMTVRHERGTVELRSTPLCDGFRDPTSSDAVPICKDNEKAIVPVGLQGWYRFLDSNATALPWDTDPLAGSPASVEPGVLRWRGAEISGDMNGSSYVELPGARSDGERLLVIHDNERPTYGVLQSPVVDLSGYGQPEARLHAWFDKVPEEIFENIGDEDEATGGTCNEARTQVSGNVTTRVGWNVRVRPVQPDGTLGQAQTVTPEGGYTNCSQVPGGEVPMLFNGSALLERPPAVLPQIDGALGTGFGTVSSLCKGATKGGAGGAAALPEPTNQCTESELAFGHEQPVFGIPMGWQDVTFDLSEFKGQRVIVEVHAMGIAEDRSEAGELRIDDFDILEGAPPRDVTVSSAPKPFIAPGLEERFELRINNTGAADLEQATVRRVILDDQGCQGVVDPVVVPVPLTDPDTGLPPLPPGKATVFQSAAASWEAPDTELERFERRLTVQTGPDQDPSEKPSFTISLRSSDVGNLHRIEATATDRDDCADDLTVNHQVLTGNNQVDVDREGVRVTVTRDLGGSSSGQAEPVVKLTAVDPWGMEAQPAFLTPPPSSASLREDAEVTVDVRTSAPGSSVEFDIAPPEDEPAWRIHVPGPDGVQEIASEASLGGGNTATVTDLPPGTYFGYVSFSRSTSFVKTAFEPFQFTIPEAPPITDDPNPKNNVVRLPGVTKANPKISISEIAPRPFGFSQENLVLPVEIENTGNVPLANVVVRADLAPSSVSASSEPVPVLLPGDTRTLRLDLPLGEPGSQRVIVTAQSEDGVRDSDGTHLLVLRKAAINPEGGQHEHWQLGGQPVFGDGLRVPPDVAADLPLDGSLDLVSSPLSGLLLNVSADLEDGFDGVALSWEETTDPLSKDRFFHPFTDKLTSSHAGADPTIPTPAITGQVTGDLRAWSTDLAGGELEPQRQIQAKDWNDHGSLVLDGPSSGSSDQGRVFWIPTAPYKDEGKDVHQELRLPLSKLDWCNTVEAVEQGRTSLTIETTERRVFHEDWQPRVRLFTGELVPAVESRSLPAQRVTALEDEHLTDWTRVTYEVDLRPALSLILAGNQPFPKSAPNELTSCQGPTDTALSNEYAKSRLVFELDRSDRQIPSLDLGWFLGEIDLRFGKTTNAKTTALGPSTFDGDDYRNRVSDDGNSCEIGGADRKSRLFEACSTPQIGGAEGHTPIQIIQWSGSSAQLAVPNEETSSQQANAEDYTEVVDWLAPLLQDRPFETTSEGALRLDDGPLRYTDATTRIDLRSVRGQITQDEDDSRNATGASAMLVMNVTAAQAGAYLQIAGAPVPAGEDESEQAASRTPWVPVPLVNNIPGAPGYNCHGGQPLLTPTPLGADDLRRVANTTGDVVRATSKVTLCADLTPLGGHITDVGLRTWVPERVDSPATEDALLVNTVDLWLASPKTQAYKPTLTGFTDSSIHEGTFELRESAILTSEPQFAHGIRAELTGATVFDGNLTVSDAVIPELKVDILQPGVLEASWELAVSVCFVQTKDLDSGQGDRCRNNAVEIDRSSVNGNVAVDEDSGTGSATVTIPWEDLRDADPDLAAGGLPVLPDDVAHVTIDIVAKPDRLIGAPSRCSSSVFDLSQDEDPLCRSLADPNPVDDRVTLEIFGPSSVELGDPGVHRLRVVPDRAPAGTPRTAVLELINPTGSPVAVEGNLTTLLDNRVKARTAVPTTILDPWTGPDAPTIIEVPLDEPSEEASRMEVEAEVGNVAVDDYRTTEDHETDSFADNEQSIGSLGNGGGMEVAEDWAKPPLPGQTINDLGIRLEANFDETVGARVAENVPISTLRDVLNEHGIPTGNPDEGLGILLSIQHQRAIPNGTHNQGKFGFMGVVAVPDDGNGNDLGDNVPGITPLNGFGPEPTQDRPQGVVPQGMPPTCNQVQGEAGSGPGAAAWSLTTGAPVFLGSTSQGINPSQAEGWETAVFEITEADLDHWAANSDRNGPPAVSFDVVVSTCPEADSRSTVLIDQVSLTTGLPILRIAEDEIRLPPAVEKSFRYTMRNAGSGSETFHLVPGTPLPQGWSLSIEDDDGRVLYDSETGRIESVRLEQHERLDGQWTVRVPTGAAGKLSTSLLAYPANNATGMVSSGAVRALLHSDDDLLHLLPGGEDQANAETGPIVLAPGAVTLRPSLEPRPDLTLNADEIVIQDAEVGREAAISIPVKNKGVLTARGVDVIAAVRGPSGFEELEPVGKAGQAFDIQPGGVVKALFEWSPSQPGEHHLRIMVDPPADGATAALAARNVEPFRGLILEESECLFPNQCDNVAERTIDVLPLQKSDLSLSLTGVPDTVTAGQRVMLTLTIQNQGGVQATGAELTFTENGLLPILDTLTTELPTIQPGQSHIIEVPWVPVTSGNIVVIANVQGPDEFTGLRVDGTSASADNTLTVPVKVLKPGLRLKLAEPAHLTPGRPAVFSVEVSNEGTVAGTVRPEAVRGDGFAIAPVLDVPLTVEPGQTKSFDMLFYAFEGAAPGPRTIKAPIQPSTQPLKLTVDKHADLAISLERTQVQPGQSDLRLRVANTGNVPLAGQLSLEGDGLAGATQLELAVNETVELTLPVTTQVGTEPGKRTVTLVLETGADRIEETAQVSVARAPGAAITSTAPASKLSGTSEATITVDNVGNAPLVGQVAIDGAATLRSTSLLSLEPGASTTLTYLWSPGIGAPGTVVVTDDDHGELATHELVGPPDPEDVRVTEVGVRPSVNVDEGDIVTVTATVENRGDADVQNVRVGFTVDGQLLQTRTVEAIPANEVALVSFKVEVPHAGTVTFGAVNLQAFQTGQSAGQVVSIEAGDTGLSLGLGFLGVLRR